ncbi:hypothetical protein [Aurantivibrio plasticivorans]
MILQKTMVASLILTASSAAVADVERIWWSPGQGEPLNESTDYANDSGLLRIYNESGAIDTKGHPFFEPLGSNGRACVTCHQPADGMSLSIDSVRQRWKATDGRDPLFAAIDGSDCPNLPQGEEKSHSLLLNYGLIRVPRPWPPQPYLGKPIEPQFTIDVVRDPTGCNTSKNYGLNAKEPAISVYRRPRPVANLKFITAVGFPFEPKDGLPLPINPKTGEPMSGNITADRRVWTIEEQTRDALRGHLEFSGVMPDEVIEEMVAFQMQIYAAQQFDFKGGDLTSDGAQGGPQYLAQADAGVLNSGRRLPMWTEFDAWLELLKNPSAEKFGHLTEEQKAFRLSVARGVMLFRNRTFLVKDSAGITDMGFGNPVRNDCNFCHNMTRTGMDVAPGQVDLGTTNEPFADPAPHLPLFKLTCKPGFAPHPHLGREVFTRDPGLALTTGRCKDIGKITIQNMRGLSARAPFFSNGLSEDIRGIVDYYVRRYQMNLTEQEKQDLTNLMSVL